LDAIRTDRLTKTYGRARGITELSLAVEEGEFFGFIGPNGAGKSTTIRLLLGLISPTGGGARVLGKDIVKDRTAILAEVGYLPSEAAFYGGMRVRELLEYSAKLRRKDCREEAARLCERLELDVTRKVNELSLGNRKKVGIVCAMQHRPRLYILDEPTSGLDPLMQEAFFGLLCERNAEGATVFLSSHVLPEVARYCRRAAIIREGRLLACDSVENLSGAGFKRVSLRGAKEMPRLDGVRDFKTDGDSMSFIYSGEPAALIAELARVGLTDVSITDPDLSEVFMHYYEGGNV
jgi:ABC-2 type transport system ATP-binding protein